MRGASIGIGAVLLFASATTAAAPDRAACLAAYEDGQVRSRGSSLLQARESLSVCSRAPCPGALQPECAKWLDQVERRIPSLVVTAKSAAGDDVAGAKLYVDDRLVSSRLDGRAIEIDPGEHRVRVEADGERAETTLVAAENVKGRVVTLVFPAKPKREPPSPPREAETKPVPVWTWIGLGVGAVGFGTFGVFAITGEGKYGDLEGCKPACNPSDVSSARTSYVIADVGLGVGLVGLAVAAVAYLTR